MDSSIYESAQVEQHGGVSRWIEAENDHVHAIVCIEIAKRDCCRIHVFCKYNGGSVAEGSVTVT